MPAGGSARWDATRIAGAVAVAIGTFALYATGRPRRVGVDVPAYVSNVVDGIWLHDHHLLPRLVGGAGLWLVDGVGLQASPDRALAWTAAAAGAACATLVYVLVLGRARAVLPAVAAAAAYAWTDVGWELSTMFELAHFATAPVLVAAVALTDPTPRRVAVAAVAVAVAVAMHLLSVGALLGLAAAAVFAWRSGAPRRTVAAPLLAGIVFLGIAQALFQTFPPPDAPPSTLLDWATRLATPGQNPAPAPPWTLAVGLTTATARGALGVVLALLLAVFAALGVRPQPADLFLVVTSAAEQAFAARIEPTNAEYFDVTIATLVILAWPALTARLGRWTILAPAALLWSHLSGPTHHAPHRPLDAGGRPGAR